MHTPNGVYELKYFFQRGLSSSSGDDVSSLIVKKKIEQLIENEKRNKPLSDSRIAEILADDGIQIARRTVAKYREELNIPSSSVRRKKI
jgi:RNA polymerase sigma-54 factor